MMVTGSTVRFCRIDPAASPAALVAAWLLDALSGTASIELSCSGAEFIMLDVEPTEAGLPVRLMVNTALAEARFAGWQLACDPLLDHDQLPGRAVPDSTRLLPVSPS